MARFDQLLNILKISFESGVSESQYHSIVNMIREYGADPDPKDIEHASLEARFRSDHQGMILCLPPLKPALNFICV